MRSREGRSTGTGRTLEAFTSAIASLHDAPVRAEVTLSEMPAPQRIAPHAVALTAEVASTEPGESLATGRFVVLHDPAAPQAWDGTWRIVTFARADLEPELASDPLLGEVGWSWLTDALDSAGLAHRALGGTVTRVVSESFAALSDREPSVEMEVRASWTPDIAVPPSPRGAGVELPAGAPLTRPERYGDTLADHLVAWCQMLCTIAGLPPLPAGVTALPGSRR